MLDSKFALVHANLATMKAQLDDPLMAAFVSQIDEIDALAAEAPGFISQPACPDEGHVFPEKILVNVSIWQDIDSLRKFTYAGRHFEVLQEGHRWFEGRVPPSYVLFWHEKQDIPTHALIQERLKYLKEKGPSPYAFDFDNAHSLDAFLEWLKRES